MNFQKNLSLSIRFIIGSPSSWVDIRQATWYTIAYLAIRTMAETTFIARFNRVQKPQGLDLLLKSSKGKLISCPVANCISKLWMLLCGGNLTVRFITRNLKVVGSKPSAGYENHKRGFPDLDCAYLSLLLTQEEHGYFFT